MRHAKKRAGISLLEVLISMFVLLVGLAGIAALLPAGRSEIKAGVNLDYAMMIARNALRDIRAREMHHPENWLATNANGDGEFRIFDATNAPTPFEFPTLGTRQKVFGVVIDPLGITAGYDPADPMTNRFRDSYGNVFPVGATLGGNSLVRVNPGSTTNGRAMVAFARSLFMCNDDLQLEASTTRGAPPTQPVDAAGKRRAANSYSWMATLVPEPAAIIAGRSESWMLSVAVFYKRATSSAGEGEAVCTINSMLGAGVGGGEFVLNTVRPIRAGGWVMLAGNVPFTDNSVSPPVNYQLRSAKWYQIISAAKPDTGTGTTAITLRGPDWSVPMASTNAWLIDNVIGVYERPITLEGH